MLSKGYTRRFSKTAAILVLIAGCLACSSHNDVTGEYLERSITVGDKRFRYRVRLPKERNRDEKVPVMLYLHGSGFRGDDNLAQIDSFRWSIEPRKHEVGFIAVLPQCESDTFWASTEMASYAIAALDAAVIEFNGDLDRLYLSGFSLGGYGTWQIAAAYPGKFAALVPIAGGVVGEHPIEPRDRAAIIPKIGTMLESAQPYEAIAKAIGQTPVWVFHGENDDAVPVDFARKIVQEMKDAGNVNVRYTEYPNDGHQIFGKAIAEPGLLEWLSQQKR